MFVSPGTVSLQKLIESPTRFLFFTGKGGVGKTSLACATAVALADAGRRVLLASTDPASNLEEVLKVKLGTTPRQIPAVPRLQALNIDPHAAARDYRERLVGPFRGKLPEPVIRGMEEQLSGACTLEIAAFDEFSRLLGDAEATADFDHVIFDTAPTGHTLRLLALPGAWSGFLSTNTSGTSCLGPLAGLQKQRSLYENSVAALADGRRTTLVLVSRAQRAALEETRRTSRELSALGVKNQQLILNGIFRTSVANDSTADALEARQTEALRSMEGFIATLPVIEVPLRPLNLLGIEALRAVLAPLEIQPASDHPAADAPPQNARSLDCLLEELAKAGRGVILTMGKGGVGKTTIAAAISTALARRGFRVHLSTTDPAAHVAAAADPIDGLTISRIDPAAETRAYVGHVMSTAGANLDTDGRALLEEDLRSPCTEEIAVFRAFARVVSEGVAQFVVLDTAPTGHTLLLLDATESYHREVARRTSDDLPEEVRLLLPRLRDPNFTRVIIVTLPEATPVHEAAALQDDLRRAQIKPWAWVINQSFAGSASRDPLLQARARNEIPYIREVLEQHATEAAVVPWVPEEPAGTEKLAQLFMPCRTSPKHSAESPPNQPTASAP